jgi:putative transposase
VILVEAESAAWELSRYVHLNPVRVRALGLDKRAQQRAREGLVEKPAPRVVRERLRQLRSYRWSSYAAYAGRVPAPGWLTVRRVLELLEGGSRAERAKAYRRFVEEPLREGLLESPWERLEAGVLLGGAEFVRRWRGRVSGDEREQPQLKRLRVGPGLAEVVRVVEAIKGEKWEAFRDRYGDWGRDLALYVARRHCGMRLRALAQAAGGLDYGSTAVTIQRFNKRLAHDRQARHAYEQVKAKLFQ